MCGVLAVLMSRQTAEAVRERELEMERELDRDGDGDGNIFRVLNRRQISFPPHLTLRRTTAGVDAPVASLSV